MLHTSSRMGSSFTRKLSSGSSIRFVMKGLHTSYTHRLLSSIIQLDSVDCYTSQAYTGFSPANTSSHIYGNKLRPVATGNWGCGAFRGDPKLKGTCSAFLKNYTPHIVNDYVLKMIQNIDLCLTYSFDTVDGSHWSRARRPLLHIWRQSVIGPFKTVLSKLILVSVSIFIWDLD